MFGWMASGLECRRGLLRIRAAFTPLAVCMLLAAINFVAGMTGAGNAPRAKSDDEQAGHVFPADRAWIDRPASHAASTRAGRE